LPTSEPESPVTAQHVAPDSPDGVAEARALKLWVVLARAQRAISDRAAADVSRHGLTLAEFGILEALYHKGPMLLGEVQKRILVSSGGITYLVDRLVERGLLERRPCAEDRRARYAALTEEGHAFVARVFPEHAKAIRGAMRGLSGSEQSTAAVLLKRLGLAAAGDK
jgi:MarR family transcriptional regulator, 2-MHQ and catechol-resistance regulon repressor